MTAPLRREVIVSKDPAEPGGLRFGSPGVGHYGSAPLVGEVVVGGSMVGRLTSLGRRIDLLVPRAVTGRVAECLGPARSSPVDYGQILLRLVSVEAPGEGGESAVEADEAVSDLPDGTQAVLSPTHGMFYRRPHPDESPCVETGQIIETGTTLGLVEVMKCFSAILYGGNDLPVRAKVVEIRADDGEEVETDQVLFVVRPA